MDNKRLLVWATFGMLLWFTYQAWMQDYGQAAAPGALQQEAPLEPTQDGAGLPDLPLSDSGVDAPAIDSAAPRLDAAEDLPPQDSGQIIRVKTDVLELEINTKGGTIQRAAALKYPIAKDRPADLVELLSPSSTHLGLIQTGLRSGGEGAEPNHLADFTSPRTNYDLGAADDIEVPLLWPNEQGFSVLKTFRLTRGSYRIDVSQEIKNNSDDNWRGAEYAQLVRHSEETERSMFNVDTYSFDGTIIYNGEKSEKLKRDDLLEEGPVNLVATAGWTGGIQHHFLTVIVPPPEQEYRYSVTARGNVSTSSTIGPAVIVAPGDRHTFSTTLFVGPKLHAQLEKIADSLTLTVDYGWLTIISEPLFWLLSKVFSVVGNWGVAIILVTILIKMVFYKLTEASGRSMAKMREIQPRMKALQDRYKDDRQALSQAMMELYKREKVNPAAGCLPILIQMPFFLAFYWVLLESVEMRQAPFALWISDLSSRDPYFILPIIMGVAMLFQQKLNPAPADPVQAKVMQVMPIVFTGFFAFFPSGLVLYWVTNTLLSIAQQWYINKIVHEEATARKIGNKGKKKNKNKESKNKESKSEEG